MNKFIICLLAWIFVLCTIVNAQLSKEQIDHLNIYVAYINESSHILKEIRRPLEDFNLHLNHAYRRDVKANYAKQFEVESLEDNQRYFVDHLCTRLPNAETPKANVNLLYAKIQSQKHILPQATNDSLTFYLDLLHENLQQFLKESDHLKTHTSNKAYIKEKDFQSSYELLIRFEELYGEYFVIKTKLHEQLRLAFQEYPIALQALINCFDLNRELLHAIRNDDSTHVSNLLPIYREKKQALRGISETFLENEEEYTFHDVETFSFLNKHLNRIEEFAADYLAKKTPQKEAVVADILPFPTYGNACYYYNEMLGKHNEHYVGYTFFLNRSLLHPQKTILKFPEEPYWYEVAIPADHKLVRPSKPFISGTTPVSQNTPMAGSPAINLVLLLDISGSMQRYNKMPLLKESFINLLDYMRPEDHISIVTYSGDAKVELSPTSATQKGMIIQTIESLSGSGKTHAGRGLKLAYQQAEQSLIPNGTNRIILATDGDLDKAYKLQGLVESSVEKGISLSIFYFPTTGDHPSLKLRLEHFTRRTAGNFRKVNKGNIDQILLEEAKGIIVLDK